MRLVSTRRCDAVWQVTVMLCSKCVIVMCDVCGHGLRVVGMVGGAEMEVLAGVEVQG